MSLWNDLGFRDNPYSPKPIQPNEIGSKLLVGREDELNRLSTYLRSTDTHSTLEGPNGVGKTSLVAVAGFRLMQDFLTGRSRQALLPLPTPFQLTADDTAAMFKRKVLLNVAQSFIQNHQALANASFKVPAVDAINQWLNSPLFHGGGAGVSVAGFGGSVNTTIRANTGNGFSEIGFETQVRGWLNDAFPSLTCGAFIGTIDNLELLDTSRAAREMLEAMRDEVLGIAGLRWVLCGARGIMRSAASSPRLQGVLGQPILIDPIQPNRTRELMETRLQVLAIREGHAQVPVDGEGFAHVYEVGNFNLRNALNYCEQFALWAASSRSLTDNPRENFELLESWMAEKAADYNDDARGVGPTAWRVFDQMAERGDAISPSDFGDFGFNSLQALRTHLQALEQANLIQSAIDETDNRRKTISITSVGWIVRYSRLNFKLPARKG